MYAQVEKRKKTKSRAVAKFVAQKKRNVKQGIEIVDNRPKGKVSLNESEDLKIEDNRTRLKVKKAIQLKAIADNYSQQSPLQKQGSKEGLNVLPTRRRVGVIQRMEPEKAKEMLSRGIRELAAVRMGKKLGTVYQEIRNFGPEEGLVTLNDYEATELGKALGLSKIEEMALYAYSQPYKNKPNGGFFMGEHQQWGNYPTGWNALNMAVDKLPSFKDLNLGTKADDAVPVFRTERATSNFMQALPKNMPCYIIHGESSMGMTRHFASTSVMGKSVHMKEGQPTLRFECPSAKFIQMFGGMSTATDGGEVFIPPGTITICNNRHTGEFGDEYTLQEVGRDTLKPQDLLNPRYPIIEDKDGSDVTQNYGHLYQGGKGPETEKSSGIFSSLKIPRSKYTGPKIKTE